MHRNAAAARRPIVFVIAFLLALPAAAVPRSGAAPDRASVIVRATSAQAAADAVRAVAGTVVADLPIVSGVAAVLPQRSVATLSRHPDVAGVFPNAPVRFAGTGHNPPGRSDDSVYTREVQADKLWAEGVDGRGVRVALIDTGVSPVPDLADRLVRVPHVTKKGEHANCADFSGEGHCDDSYGHGTFVAGIIAGTGVSSGGLYKGVAPKADIVSVKIAGRDGSADVSKVLAAIQWVVSFRETLNIRVLNLSLGTDSTVSYRYDPLNFAVQRAWLSGIAVVVSASNRGPGAKTISKPADDPLVMTAGAVDDRGTPGHTDDTLPRFSGRGPTHDPDNLAKPDFVAPGARLVSLRSPGSFLEEKVPPREGDDRTYRRGSGTSMSAAVVSGAAALALQAHPSWTPNRLKFALMSTSMKVASHDWNDVGAGLIRTWSAARKAPDGLANQNVFVLSDASGSLDGSRGNVRVKRECTSTEKALDPDCEKISGNETAQGGTFDAERYRDGEWNPETWYTSQWNFLLGSSWYVTEWDGESWDSGVFRGSSWYGEGEEQTNYGSPVLGSSWYGAWE